MRGGTGAARRARGIVPERVLGCVEIGVGIGVGMCMLSVTRFVGAVAACSGYPAGAVIGTTLELPVRAVR